MKRKTFKGILIKRLLILVPISVLILVFLSALYCSYFFAVMEANFMNMESLCVNRMYSIYSEMEKRGKDINEPENLEYLGNQIKMYIGNDVFISSAAALYYEGTKEKICDSEEIAFLALKGTNDKEYTIYFCDTSYLGEYATMIKKLYKDYFYEEYLGYETYVEDCYVKGNDFLPGKVCVEYISKENGKTINSEFDLTPSVEALEGYKHIVIKDEDYQVVGPLIRGSEKNSQASELVDWYIELFYDESTGVNYEYTSSYSVFYSNYCSTTLLTFGDGTKIRLFNAMETNLMSEYGGWIIGFYAVVMLVVIILIVITARLKYVKLRAGYDMEDYRRTMTNAMAHDLKSPLMAISGYAENLKNNVHTDKKDYYAESIINNVDYMNDLIANILDLSKVEGKKIRFNKEQIEAKLLFEEVLKKYDSWIEDKKLKINMDGEVTLKAEKQLLMQAFDNIIGNAMKYCDNNSSIDIKMGKKKISVSNTCSNKLGEKVSELWKPFVKGDNSRSNKKGSGIGLTIVKNIVEGHGYKVNLSYEENIFKVDIVL